MITGILFLIKQCCIKNIVEIALRVLYNLPLNNKLVERVFYTMRFKVDKELCIGCGMCIDMCPEVFKYDDSGISEAVGDDITSKDVEGKAEEAMNLCPVEAIEAE